ncbi:MAG: peptide chain release factor aRF-1 [Candidatus Micrarchaeia archaeon]
MQVESEKLYTFKKQIRVLKEFRGSGTQLVSVYIPAGYPINEVSSKLRGEMSQAENIKSKQTRSNVIGALERIITVLKGYKKTPDSGIAIFSGNISEDPSKTDIQTFVIEPPYKLSVSIYRCDSSFFLEPLERMLEATDVYGIVAMDGRDATIAILRGTETHVMRKLHNPTPSKVKVGGQSARRYQRIVEEGTENYYKRIGEAMDEVFLGKVKGVIIGGPGPAKENFLKERPFNYQHKILGVVDTGYVDEHGISDIVSKSGEILAEQEAIKEKALVEKFIKEVVKGGLATYGLKQVEDAIRIKQAELVLVSEGLEYSHIKLKCGSCGNEETKVLKEKPKEPFKCPKCGADMFEEETKPLVEYIIDLANENQVKVEVISTDTSEGMQFLHGFAGLGAFLRYRI